MHHPEGNHRRRSKPGFFTAAVLIIMAAISSCSSDTITRHSEMEDRGSAASHLDTAEVDDDDADEVPDSQFQEVGLDFYGITMEIPSGWSLEEQPRNEAGELLVPGEKPTCVWYVLDAGGGSRVFIQPDCGYADAGPVECPEDAVMLLDDGEIARYLDEASGLYRYTSVGTAQTAAEDGTLVSTRVCYVPPVLGLPLEEPVVTAHVSVETGGGPDTGVLLDLADQILLSAEGDR